MMARDGVAEKEEGEAKRGTEPVWQRKPPSTVTIARVETA